MKGSKVTWANVIIPPPYVKHTVDDLIKNRVQSDLEEEIIRFPAAITPIFVNNNNNNNLVSKRCSHELEIKTIICCWFALRNW